MRQVKRQQISQRHLVRMYREARHHREDQGKHQQVIPIDIQRALPQPRAYVGRVLLQFADVEPPHQQRRNKDKSLRRRHKTQRLVHKVAEARGKMRQRHPDQEKPPKGVEFGSALEFWQMNVNVRQESVASVRKSSHS